MAVVQSTPFIFFHVEESLDSAIKIQTLDQRINELQSELFKAQVERCCVSSLKWSNRIICCPYSFFCALLCCPCICFVGFQDYEVSENVLCHGEENRYMPDICCHLPPETRLPPIESCPECIPACCCEVSNKEKRIQQELDGLKGGTEAAPAQEIMDYVPPLRNLVGRSSDYLI